MKALLLSLSCVCAAVILFFAADIFGMGGAPWYGWWDSTTTSSGAPFVLNTAAVSPHGASDKAGIRVGDLVDLRDQSLAGRFARVYQLSGTQPVDLVVRRAGGAVTLRVLGSSTLEGPHVIKVPAKALSIVAALWFLGCALLITLRRSNSADARTIAAILLLQVLFLFQAGASSVPSVPWTIAVQLVAAASIAASAALLLRLTTRHTTPSALARAVSAVGYVAISVEFIRCVLGLVGLTTLWFDPIPYLEPTVAARGAYATGWDLMLAVPWLVILIAAILAVRTTPRPERARAMWLLLPLPIAFFVQGIVSSCLGLVSSWAVFTILVAVYNVFWLLGGFVVTYAIVRRRVLDLQFVINRTLVVGVVSLIVVTSFILLEGAIQTVLAGASHATGIVAGGALALGLGFSMRYIHDRVDRAIDTLFFRKRHEDERSLRDFAKEAAFITDTAALLDRTIWNVSEHTDARAAALFLLDGERYAPVRMTGVGQMHAIGENDGVVLALKTWHRPLDPHRHNTQLRAALAVPLLARGQLLGILVLDERTGGEAYAPDEIDAVAQFAHGVGSALDNLQIRGDDATFRDSLSATLASLGRKIDNLDAKFSAGA